MEKLADSRQILCPYCKTDCLEIEDLGTHLLDLHGSASTGDITGSGLEATNRPLLTKDAEDALGRLIQAKGPRAEEARNFLVESNLALVVSVVMKRPLPPSQVPDVIQEGNLGLMRAAEMFDPSKGFRFSTYAMWWILKTISRGQASLKLVPIPDNVRWKTNKARRMLRDGKAEEDVAAELDMSTAQLKRSLGHAAATTVSISQERRDGGSSLEGMLASAEAPTNPFAADELRKVLHGLKERQRLVLTMRFGLDGKPEQTLEEVSRVIGVTRERIRQIEQKALQVLKRRHERRGTLLNLATIANWRSEASCAPPEIQEPIAAAVDRDGQRHEVKREAIVAAKTDLNCPKCGLEYKRGGHYRDQHIKKCKGRLADGSDGSVEEEPDLPDPRTLASRAEKAAVRQEPLAAVVIDKVPGHLAGSHVGKTIEDLLARREKLHSEVSGINQAVETLVRFAAPADVVTA